MARKRMIDPGLWTDTGFMALCPRGRLLWIGLVSQADDEGRGHGAAVSLKAAIFPGDADVSAADVDELRRSVAATMRVTFYAVDGHEYYQLTKWASHQSINHASKSTIPPMEGALQEDSRRTPVVLREGSRKAPPNELTNELTKEARAPAREAPAVPSSPKELVYSWYRAFTAKTAQTLEPGPDQYRRGVDVWKRAKPEQLAAARDAYFDRDQWFTEPKQKGAPREYSFANFCTHLDYLIASLAAPPGKRAPKTPTVKRCPNGHPYAVEDGGCMECGWKPEDEEADDGPDFGDR